MRPETWISLLMILFGGVSLSGVNPQLHPSPVGWALGLSCMVAGAALFARITLTFFIAVGVALLVGAGGVAAILHHPNLALPGPWGLSVGVGLYITLRLFMSKQALTARSHPAPIKPAAEE